MKLRQQVQRYRTADRVSQRGRLRGFLLAGTRQQRRCTLASKTAQNGRGEKTIA